MNRWLQTLAAGLVFLAGTAMTASAFESLPALGETFIHDPSPIVKDGDRYYVYGTGPGVRTKWSTDLVHWTNGRSALEELPRWTFADVPGFRGYSLWAPDLVRLNGKFYLYYAVSTFGKHVSAIGLATSPTLDQSATNYGWTDCGPVIESKTNSLFNAIDPSVFQDVDGKLWMAFGSFWKGIYLVQLDPRTGLRADSDMYQLAWNDSIEASCLARHGKYYYLFVNWGLCCRGTNSTYEVRVGRSENITGPYLDRDGRDLLDGGGTKFLASTGRFIGPGQIGILEQSNVTWFSYHYYDAASHGHSRLGLGKIDWSDGWPVPEGEGRWKLVWHDEFETNGPPNPANWNFEHGFVRNEELQWYQPENAYCTNGTLVIEARREHKPNPGYVPGRTNWRTSREWIDYTSASLTTRGLHEFKYGKFEMRARIDTRLGSWPAFWTLGTQIHGWPACGEVDIMEYYTGQVLANVAYAVDGKAVWSSPRQSLANLGADWPDLFHVWTMEWDESGIDLRLDGRRVNHFDVATADASDRGNPFHQPVYFILNQ
ncbi:MAG TPA: family 43 glycosylhydrolase, partial [Verrucomicrobiae bacterium]|nr:family 43 glycosylhydrolase [Verrucomicrobiae bacterium]